MYTCIQLYTHTGTQAHMYTCIQLYKQHQEQQRTDQEKKKEKITERDKTIIIILFVKFLTKTSHSNCPPAHPTPYPNPRPTY